MTFNAEKTANDIVKWIQEWFEQNGKGCNAVIGISGGKDSTIAAALCVRALGKDRVIGVLLPNGEQDTTDAREVCRILDIPNFMINIKNGVDATLNEFGRLGIEVSEQTKINIPPRERTKVIRAICQSMNGRMVNTCNLSEDYVGYFTIGGDGDGDFSPFGGLTATEVIEIGRYLEELPASLVDKAPADDLCGKTDEDAFGFTYKVLDNYIRTREIADMEIKRKIDAMHEKNLFKLQPMPCFQL